MNFHFFARGIGLLALLLLCGVAAAQPASPAAAREPPLSAEQQKCLKERQRVLREVNQLVRAGKQAEALGMWEKQMALERKTFGSFHRAMDEAARVLAQLHE